MCAGLREGRGFTHRGQAGSSREVQDLGILTLDETFGQDEQPANLAAHRALECTGKIAGLAYFERLQTQP